MAKKPTGGRKKTVAKPTKRTKRSSPPKHKFACALYGWITHTDLASLDPAATKAGVADAAAAFAKALREGAEEVMPPARVMEGVTVAIVRAPGGVPIGFSGP